MTDATTQTQTQTQTEVPDSGGGRLALDPSQPLVSALVGAFGQVLIYAVAITETVEREPERAVHEYRKSIRRSRSVLRMLRPALKKSTRRALEEELRALARPTSILRDADVLVETCDRLELAGEAAEALADLRAQIVAHRDALRSRSEAARILGTGAQRLPALVETLAEAVRQETRPKRLEAAFERTFRRSEKARRRALRRGTDKAVHNWRKRVKEVRYQLELLAEPEGGPVEGLRRVYAALAKRLGEITDVIALRHYLDAHADAVQGAASDLLHAAFSAHVSAEVALAADPIVEARARLFTLGPGRPDEVTPIVADDPSDNADP